MENITTPPFLSPSPTPFSAQSAGQPSAAGHENPSLKISPAELAAHCASSPHSNEPGVLDSIPDDTNLMRSFEMIFHLHQRSEEVRFHLHQIDQILLQSRTVAGLIERITQTLQSDFDISVAKIILREDHPIAAIFQWAAPNGGSSMPPQFFENQTLHSAVPIIIDDPSSELPNSLFEKAPVTINSAAVARLMYKDNELGLLCLGSKDPSRYNEHMNTDLIASLAEKVALGLLNAWDHETSIRRALMTSVEGVYSHAFFLEFLQKEFNAAWRNRSVFALMAVSWKSRASVWTIIDGEILELFVRNLRSADLTAPGDVVPLWVLLPHTDMESAQRAAARLMEIVNERYAERVSLHFGITEFCREAAVMPMLLKQASLALAESEQAEETTIVAQRLSLEDYTRRDAARRLDAFPS